MAPALRVRLARRLEPGLPRHRPDPGASPARLRGRRAARVAHRPALVGPRPSRGRLARGALVRLLHDPHLSHGPGDGAPPAGAPRRLAGGAPPLLPGRVRALGGRGRALVSLLRDAAPATEGPVL